MWPRRGTLHFVAAPDARWMTELLAARPAAAAASRLRAFGIDGAVLARARRVLVKHLDSGRPSTRTALYARFLGLEAFREEHGHSWQIASSL